MDVRRLTETVSVSPQIAVSDISNLANCGFSDVICNRPDSESIGQPKSDDIRKACEQNDVKYHDIPISGSNITPEDIIRFRDAISSADGAILAFCRTGTRSTRVWALSQAGKIPTNLIISTASAAGYDLTQLKDVLNTRENT